MQRYFHQDECVRRSHSLAVRRASICPPVCFFRPSSHACVRYYPHAPHVRRAAHYATLSHTRARAHTHTHTDAHFHSPFCVVVAQLLPRDGAKDSVSARADRKGQRARAQVALDARQRKVLRQLPAIVPPVSNRGSFARSFVRSFARRCVCCFVGSFVQFGLISRLRPFCLCVSICIADRQPHPGWRRRWSRRCCCVQYCQKPFASPVATACGAALLLPPSMALPFLFSDIIVTCIHGCRWSALRTS